jgi:hypothetical protein
MDPRIRIHAKMSWIRNTEFYYMFCNTQGHEEYLHSVTSPEKMVAPPGGASRVLVNPNFRRRRDEEAATGASNQHKRHSVHISNLSQLRTASAGAHPNRHSVHINPKMQAVLQQQLVPEAGGNKIVINPRFQLQQEQEAGEQLQQKQQQKNPATVHINPNFRPSPPAREEFQF